jgi:predicted RNA binding protein YcfA (HicA-like mRNA interferase family)
VPRFPALTPRRLLRLLQQHGFVVDHQTGSHAVLYQAKTGRRVVVPMHSRTLPRGTMAAILKEAGIPLE